MTRGTVVVGSLQYSPVYKSHCCALGKQAEANGFSVVYLFSGAYEWMLNDKTKEKTIFIGRSTSMLSSARDGFNPIITGQLSRVFAQKPRFCYLYNFHPFLNYRVARIAKKNGTMFIQHVQEPYVENKKTYGGFKQYWLSIFEKLQERVIDRSDEVILSSQRSLQLFNKRYPGFSGPVNLVPLMYEDLGTDDVLRDEDRRYITFIGPPVKAKGPHILINVVKWAEENGLNETFLLITRAMPKEKEYFEHPKLRVVHKEIITDEEMGSYLRSSKMVFTPYTVATQSSVILTSFMYGTPALSSNVGGLPEFVEHGKTGYLVSPEAPVSDWIEGINFINNNLVTMTPKCRASFVQNYSEVNWGRYFDKIFQASITDGEG